MNQWERDSQYASPRWIEVLNASGAQIPAFGAVQVTGAESDGTPNVGIPTGTVTVPILFNGPVAIPAGSTVRGTATRDYPCHALYHEPDGTPAVGETWGPSAGTCKLRKERPGFYILGGVTGPTGNKRVLVTPTVFTLTPLFVYLSNNYAGGSHLPNIDSGRVVWARALRTTTVDTQDPYTQVQNFDELKWVLVEAGANLEGDLSAGYYSGYQIGINTLGNTATTPTLDPDGVYTGPYPVYRLVDAPKEFYAVITGRYPSPIYNVQPAAEVLGATSIAFYTWLPISDYRAYTSFLTAAGNSNGMSQGPGFNTEQRLSTASTLLPDIYPSAGYAAARYFGLARELSGHRGVPLGSVVLLRKHQSHVSRSDAYSGTTRLYEDYSFIYQGRIHVEPVIWNGTDSDRYGGTSPTTFDNSSPNCSSIHFQLPSLIVDRNHTASGSSLHYAGRVFVSVSTAWVDGRIAAANVDYGTW